MSAPASLAYAKILVPEVEKYFFTIKPSIITFRRKKHGNSKMAKNEATNILDAATQGIQDRISTITDSEAFAR